MALAYYGGMTTSSGELASTFRDIVLARYGQHQTFEKTVCPMLCQATDLVFLIDSKALPDEVGVIVMCQDVADNIKESSKVFLVVVEDVRLTQAKIKQYFDGYKFGDVEWSAIHASAVVRSSSRLGAGCRIGPNVVIGANCVLGDQVIVRAGAVIEHGVLIGSGSVINVNVNIAYCSQLGKRVITSGQTGVLGHRTVADGAILVQRCGVSEDITTGGMWAGSLAKPFKEFVRRLGLQKKVAKLELQVKELKCQLAG